MKAQTRSLLSLCLAVVLVLSAVLGTIAYMTASSKVTNTFTVGSFNKPVNPDKKTDEDGNPNYLDGYIHESNWEENTDGHKIVPGSTTIKDPKVGIGKGSESAYVYVYIINNLVNTNNSNAVYFTLNDGWTAVDDQTVSFDDNYGRHYVSGLFKYDGVLDATQDDAWTTTAVFDKVETDKNVDTSKLGDNMVVWAYIHQQKDNGDEIDVNDVVTPAAIAWSKTLTSSTSGN